MEAWGSCSEPFHVHSRPQVVRHTTRQHHVGAGELRERPLAVVVGEALLQVQLPDQLAAHGDTSPTVVPSSKVLFPAQAHVLDVDIHASKVWSNTMGGSHVPQEFGVVRPQLTQQIERVHVGVVVHQQIPRPACKHAAQVQQHQGEVQRGRSHVLPKHCGMREVLEPAALHGLDLQQRLGLRRGWGRRRRWSRRDVIRNEGAVPWVRLRRGALRLQQASRFGGGAFRLKGLGFSVAEPLLPQDVTLACHLLLQLELRHRCRSRIRGGCPCESGQNTHSHIVGGESSTCQSVAEPALPGANRLAAKGPNSALPWNIVSVRKHGSPARGPASVSGRGGGPSMGKNIWHFGVERLYVCCCL
mmetsp:Transcript_49488/g.92200  ORF Transcript_49488/g.92200 Transcript_49488/m.92200 type:complete len:358 (+) Transcript_49488:544-1617(+)